MTRTPSKATLAGRAFVKVQRLRQKIADNHDCLDNATVKHAATDKRLREELVTAEAELATFQVE